MLREIQQMSALITRADGDEEHATVTLRCNITQANSMPIQCNKRLQTLTVAILRFYCIAVAWARCAPSLTLKRGCQRGIAYIIVEMGRLEGMPRTIGRAWPDWRAGPAAGMRPGAG